KAFGANDWFHHNLFCFSAGLRFGSKGTPGGEMFYRKKPVVIKAMRFGDNLEEIERFVGSNGRVVLDDSGTWFAIDTLEGVMRANPGDWIIKGVKGEFYPCKPDIFEATYEAVDAVRDKGPVCVKCGAKLIVTSTSEFEPSISHAQCCGLSYTIG